MAMSSNHSIITISYTELHQSSPSPSTLFAKIAQGFGNQDDCKGIIAITDIPNYPALRSKALTLIHRLATQTSQEVLEELEDPKSYYAVGWSHGKEKVEADKFDLGKGSFYFNPITDDPLDAILERDFGNGKVDEEDLEEEQTTLEIPTETMARRERERTEFLSHAEGNGAFYAPNIWPDKALPELRETAMEMGGLIRDIGKLVARQCDEYVLSQCDTDTYSSGKIQNVIDNSLCCKGRLLHYFPVFVAPVEDKNDANANANANSNGVCENNNQDQTVAKDVDFSDWCGWHNDHCSLTGLVPAMYFNSDGEEVSCPDPAAGLYIKSRNGALVHVQVPSDALAFQIGGEYCSQVVLYHTIH